MLKFDAELQQEVIRFLLSWAADVKALARQLVPVKSGKLRESIYVTVKDWLVSVGADATYAYFVEAGTKYMAARPYLYPAIQAYLPQLEQMILAAIDAAKAEANLS